jgi:hypothetical protein
MDKRNRKNSAVPVRFDKDEEGCIRRLSEETGLSKSEVIRRACRFAFPQFMSGRTPIIRIEPSGREA